MAMNLKPFRDVNEHDVINLYSTVEGNLTKGTLVEYVYADLDNQNGFGDPLVNTPGYAWSADYVVNWKVQAATSGSQKLAGILLRDVKSTVSDPWAVDARFVDEYKMAEQQFVPSGRAVPFLTEGYARIIGFQGSPAAGSGAAVSPSGQGVIVVTAPNAPGSFGKFLTSSGADGSAILKFRI